MTGWQGSPRKRQSTGWPCTSAARAATDMQTYGGGCSRAAKRSALPRSSSSFARLMELGNMRGAACARRRVRLRLDFGGHLRMLGRNKCHRQRRAAGMTRAVAERTEARRGGPVAGCHTAARRRVRARPPRAELRRHRQQRGYRAHPRPRCALRTVREATEARRALRAGRHQQRAEPQAACQHPAHVEAARLLVGVRQGATAAEARGERRRGALCGHARGSRLGTAPGLGPDDTRRLVAATAGLTTAGIEAAVAAFQRNCTLPEPPPLSSCRTPRPGVLRAPAGPLRGSRRLSQARFQRRRASARPTAATSGARPCEVAPAPGHAVQPEAAVPRGGPARWLIRSQWM